MATLKGFDGYPERFWKGVLSALGGARGCRLAVELAPGLPEVQVWLESVMKISHQYFPVRFFLKMPPRRAPDLRQGP